MYYMPHYEYPLEKHNRLTKQTNTPAKKKTFFMFNVMDSFVRSAIFDSVFCFLRLTATGVTSEDETKSMQMRKMETHWYFFLQVAFLQTTYSGCGTLKRIYDTVQVFLWNVWRSMWSQLQRSWASMIDVHHFRVILNESCCSNKIYLSGYDQRYEGKPKGDKYKTLWYTIEECN